MDLDSHPYNMTKIIVWHWNRKVSSLAVTGHILSCECVFLSRGGRRKFSSPKLREAQVQGLKIQTGRLFLCTKSYTSTNVFSPSPHSWHSKGLIQPICSPNKLHLSKRPVSGGEERNHNKRTADFLCQLTVKHVGKTDPNTSLQSWRSTVEMTHMFVDGVSVDQCRADTVREADSAQEVERCEEAHSTHLCYQSVSWLHFACCIEPMEESVLYTWQRVQLRLAATWESYTRKMSKQIRWKEAADFQSLGCFQESGLRFSAAEDNVDQAGWSHSRSTQTLPFSPPPLCSQRRGTHSCIPDTMADLGKETEGD